MNKKEIREIFRSLVKKRDGNRCRMCGRSDVPLDVHHITPRKYMPAGGYVPENGITLCDPPNEVGCHRMAEDAISFIAGDSKIEDFRSQVLYERIGSSYGDALDASCKLMDQLSLTWDEGRD